MKSKQEKYEKYKKKFRRACRIKYKAKTILENTAEDFGKAMLVGYGYGILLYTAFSVLVKNDWKELNPFYLPFVLPSIAHGISLVLNKIAQFRINRLRKRIEGLEELTYKTQNKLQSSPFSQDIL